MPAMTRMTVPSRISTRPPAPGFTLMEILIAIGIFAVGMVAVASIFPVAIALQRESVEEVMARQAASNIEALMGGRPFTYGFNGTDSFGDLDFYDDEPSFVGFVQALPDDVLGIWTANDRSFPSTDRVNDREIYWVPLVQNLGTQANPDWRTFVFVLAGDGLGQPESEWDPNVVWANKDDDPAYFPGVAWMDNVNPVLDADFVRLEFDNGENSQFPESDDEPDQIRLGDFFLGDNGVVYRAIAADGFSVTIELSDTSLAPQQYIWYGRPSGPGRASPTKRILVLTDAVVEP